MTITTSSKYHTAESREFISQSLGTRVLAPSAGAFEDKYTLVRQISRGAYGLVFMAVRKHDNLSVIVKLIERHRTPTIWKGGRPLPVEALVLNKLSDVRGVIGIVEYFQGEEEIHLVLEHVPNSVELHLFVMSGRGWLSEGATRFFIRQVVVSLQEMWQRGFVHGDVKETNLLLDKNRVEVKLLDLGSVETTLYNDEEDGPLKVLKGTNSYMPPEAHAMNGFKDGDSLTVFSLGVTAYRLMFRRLPFPLVEGGKRGVPDIKMSQIKAELVATRLHPAGIHFIFYCLHVEPGKRLKLHNLLEHQWLKHDLPAEDEVLREINDSAIMTPNSESGEESDADNNNNDNHANIQQHRSDSSSDDDEEEEKEDSASKEGNTEVGNKESSSHDEEGENDDAEDDDDNRQERHPRTRKRREPVRGGNSKNQTKKTTAKNDESGTGVTGRVTTRSQKRRLLGGNRKKR